MGTCEPVSSRSEEAPAPGDALQLAFAAIRKLDVRPDDQGWNGTRNEDLTGTGEGRHPGTDVDRHPRHVVAAELDLAGVDPGPNLDVEALQGRSDGNAHSTARPGLSKVALIRRTAASVSSLRRRRLALIDRARARTDRIRLT